MVGKPNTPPPEAAPPASPARSNLAGGGAITDADSDAGQAVQSGTGATVPTLTHQHPLSNANAKLNIPSEANGGMPILRVFPFN